MAKVKKKRIFKKVLPIIGPSAGKIYTHAVPSPPTTEKSTRVESLNADINDLMGVLTPFFLKLMYRSRFREK